MAGTARAEAAEARLAAVVEPGPDALEHRVGAFLVEVSGLDRRVDPARAGVAPRSGSGIGLTIAREFLVANGGTIEVERTGPDGTTFALRLPRAG